MAPSALDVVGVSGPDGGSSMASKPCKQNLRLYTREEVGNAEGEMLFIIEKQVYRVPPTWAEMHHPGGHILLLDAKGADISIPFWNNHNMSVTTPVMERFHVGFVESETSEMETEFVGLIKKLTNDPAWFKADPWFYGGLMLRYLMLLAFSVGCVVYGEAGWIRCGLGGLLMGAYFQQVAFLGHDLGHNGVTHDRKTDQLIGFFWGNMMSGISVGWWKATHNVHHLVTNSVEFDPDIQHMPVFAITDRFFHDVYSHYHMRTFVFDPVSRWFVRHQHLLYYPILAVARFNLYIQSFVLLLAPGKSYRRWGGNDRLAELATLGIFWAWFGFLLSLLPTVGERILFLLLSHAVAGLLHVQITISHFPMPVVHGNPWKVGEKNFIQSQLSGSLDVDCPPAMDWFHGGLQFQAVHHLITRVPRHNLRKLREEIVLPFCKKWDVEYKMAGFIDCNRMVINTLKNTADKVHPFLLEAIHAAG